MTGRRRRCHCLHLSGRLCTCQVIPEAPLGVFEIFLAVVCGVGWVVSFLACVWPG